MVLFVYSSASYLFDNKIFILQY